MLVKMALIKSVAGVIVGGLLLLVMIPSNYAARGIYHKSSCFERSDCGNTKETYLMCFEGRCQCKHGQKFDFTAKGCRVEAGQACKIGHENGIKCTTGTVCKPRTLTEGICECVSGSEDEDCFNGVIPPAQPALPAPTAPPLEPKIESQIAAAPVSSSTSFLNAVCTSQSEDRDCDSKKTFLKCFRMGSGPKCTCRGANLWDEDRKQCVIKKGADCLIGGQHCEAGAKCQLLQDLNGKETAKASCVDAKEKKVVDLTISQVGDRAEANNEIQKSSSTMKQVAKALGVTLLGKPCRPAYQEDDCGTKQTWLRCLRTDHRHECLCGNLQEFDTVLNICVIRIGAKCVFNPNLKHELQPCVRHATCSSHKNLKGVFSPEGTCCLTKNQDICNESGQTYRGVSKPITAALVVAEKKETNYKDRPCTGSSHEKLECGSERTFLSCKSVGGNESKKCICSKVHRFDENTNKCAIEVGGACSMDKPQSCVSGAKCLPHKNLQNQETREGTCCLNGDPKLCGTPSTSRPTLGNGRGGVGTPEKFRQPNHGTSITPLIFLTVTTCVLSLLARVTL